MGIAKYWICSIALAFLFVAVWSCERDDNEPSTGAKSISRLYVSTSNYDANVSSPLRNVFVIDPADKEEFPTLNRVLKFASDLKGGNAIYYNDSTGLVFQSSYNYSNYIDTSIRVLGVSNTGAVAQVARLRNRRLTKVRGLEYSPSFDQLYAINVGRDTISVFAFDTPRNRREFVKIAKEVMLDFTPWAMQLVHYDLYLSKTGNNGGVVVYKNFVPTLNAGSDKDTLVNILPSYTLTVSGATDIQGMAYSPSKDLLVLTDVSGSASRILIFEGFSAHSSAGAISPTRIITGGDTKLQQPVNVALDNREDSDWIYVADAGAKRIFRFGMLGEGNVAPSAEMILGADVNSPYTPVSLSLMSFKGN